MARRHYSDVERAAALAVLDANGGDLSATARTVGIPRKTLERWRNLPDNAAPAELRHDKKVALAELFDTAIRDALSAAATKTEAASYKDLMTGAGIATDKHQLLTGGATSRVETRDADMTPDEAIDIVRRERELRVVDGGGKGKRSA